MTELPQVQGLQEGPYAKATHAVPTEPSPQLQPLFLQDGTSCCSHKGLLLTVRFMLAWNLWQFSCFTHLNVKLSGPDFNTMFSKL